MERNNDRKIERKSRLWTLENRRSGVLGNLGRANLSAKTTKLSDKARSKCLRGFRKFISERERGKFEREGATAGCPGRAGPRGLRTLISESSNGFFGLFGLLGGLVGMQRNKAEHIIFESHFERRTSSTKRLHNARAKTCGEDHATPF